MGKNLLLYPDNFSNDIADDRLTIEAAMLRMKILARDAALRSVNDLRISGQSESAIKNNKFTQMPLIGKQDIPIPDGSDFAARENHTGTQLSSTISDFNTSVDSRIGAQKGSANGIATLDANTKVTLAQIPDLKDLFDSYIQVGVIWENSTDILPSDRWRWADGQSVNRTDFPALAAIYQSLSFPYGSSSTTTMNLPNKTGRVSVGIGILDGNTYDLGSTGGSAKVTLTQAQMPAHAHNAKHAHEVAETPHSHNVSITTIGNLNAGGYPVDAAAETFFDYPTKSATTGITVKEKDFNTESSGGGEAHNNMQPYLVTRFMVKVK